MTLQRPSSLLKPFAAAGVALALMGAALAPAANAEVMPHTLGAGTVYYVCPATTPYLQLDPGTWFWLVHYVTPTGKPLSSPSVLAPYGGHPAREMTMATGYIDPGVGPVKVFCASTLAEANQ